MRIRAAAIQMPSEPTNLAGNLERADGLLRGAVAEGVELAVLPELFNTGYGFLRDFAPYGETAEGPTLRHLRARCREWRIDVAAGFVEREGSHLYDALAYVSADGDVHIYRKRHLVFWERFRFRPGREPVVVPTRWGRVGLAVCADMIYKRVWRDYRDRIDLAIVAAAWPDFACRNTGRKHWLFGHVGALSGDIPGLVAADLGVPVVFANQCGETKTVIPVLWQEIADRFAGRSSVCDGRHGPPVVGGTGEGVVSASITLHPHRGMKTWHFMSPSARAGSSSASPRSTSD